MVQCGAMWCSVLHCGAVCCVYELLAVLAHADQGKCKTERSMSMMGCSGLHCVAVCCSVLQCVACRKHLDVETHANQGKCQAEKNHSVMCSSALKCIAVYCSVMYIGSTSP